MEVLRFNAEKRLQETISEGNAEMRQMRITVQSLRDEMDTVRGKYEDKLQEAERATRGHVNHLQDIIKALRTQLEGQHGH